MLAITSPIAIAILLAVVIWAAYLTRPKVLDDLLTATHSVSSNLNISAAGNLSKAIAVNHTFRLIGIGSIFPYMDSSYGSSITEAIMAVSILLIADLILLVLIKHSGLYNLSKAFVTILLQTIVARVAMVTLYALTMTQVVG